MATIACLLANDFEDSEFIRPVDILRSRGHDVVTLGSKAGAIVRGKRGEEEVVLDDAVAARAAEEFDALLIPGGYSPDHLRMLHAAVAFCRDFARTGRPIAAICHGPQLLISAGLVSDHRMTSWPSVRVDLENAGATWIDEAVVVDGPFITSRKPEDLGMFSQAIVERLESSERA